MSRGLAAFDFDHTIANENTDVCVVNLLDRSRIPECIKKLHRSDGWTSYMQGIFRLCHQNNIDQDKITDTIKRIECVKGFDVLLRQLKNELNFDVIIISDSNSYFIDTWLDAHGLKECIFKVFTNPAQFLDDELKIEMYHLQESCKLSTKNLCKGQILQDFIEERKQNEVVYDRVIYVGDGTNDFCPILRLNVNDLACVRSKYKCAELVKSALAGKTLDEEGKVYNIKAKLLFWNEGDDILNAVKEMTN